jgi:hypothetical protein
MRGLSTRVTPAAPKTSTGAIRQVPIQDCCSQHSTIGPNGQVEGVAWSATISSGGGNERKTASAFDCWLITGWRTWLSQLVWVLLYLLAGTALELDA